MVLSPAPCTRGAKLPHCSTSITRTLLNDLFGGGFLPPCRDFGRIVVGTVGICIPREIRQPKLPALLGVVPLVGHLAVAPIRDDAAPTKGSAS